MGIREATQEEIAKLTGNAAKEKTPSVGGFDPIEFATGLARSIGQGITFGTADEAEAWATSLLGDETYKQARDRIRGELEQFRTQYPKTAYGSEIGSSVAMPLGVAKLVGKGIVKGGELLNKPATDYLAGKVSQAGQKIATSAPKVTKAVTSPVGTATGLGAAYGAGAAPEVSDIPEYAATSAILSGGAQKVLPPITEAAKDLMRRGVPLTVGQKFGGAIGGLEERLSGLPIADFLVGGARRRAIDKFGTAAYNEALAPIGEKLPMKLKGRDAYIAAESKINNAYKKVLSDVTIPAPTALVASVGAMAADLPEKEAKQLAAIIKREISQRVKDGKLTGEAFKEAQSAIRTNAYQFMTSTDAYQKQLGQALSDAAEELTSSLARANPSKAGELSNIDATWSRFKPMQLAAGSKGQEGGVTPAKLLEKVYSQSRRAPSVLARGEGRMQGLAETGKGVLGTKVPDTGTAGRNIFALGALGYGLDPVTTALAAGGLGAAYSRPGQLLASGAIEAARRAGRSPAAAGLLSAEADKIVGYEQIKDKAGNLVNVAKTAGGQWIRQ